jgi:hypothetical protein
MKNQLGIIQLSKPSDQTKCLSSKLGKNEGIYEGLELGKDKGWLLGFELGEVDGNAKTDGCKDGKLLECVEIDGISEGLPEGAKLGDDKGNELGTLL